MVVHIIWNDNIDMICYTHLSLLTKFISVQNYRRSHHEPIFPDTGKGTPYKGGVAPYQVLGYAYNTYNTYPIHRQAVLIVVFIGCCRCPCL